jgi:hypothetical protein
LGKTLAMDTRLVERKLVDALLRPYFVHELGITVTSSAKFGNLFSLDLADEAFLGTHRYCHFRAGGIASVATCAGKAVLRMDVILDELCRLGERSIQGRVARHARGC